MGGDEMKISEIVGSVVVQPPEEVPVNSFPQRIAKAFTKEIPAASIRAMATQRNPGRR